MKSMRYSLILVLALAVAACGVRRDLKLPEEEKQADQQSESLHKETPVHEQ
jgi:predicted small lipoprotein YifL